MTKKIGGSTLTQIAVPAALIYANQLFGSKRRRPVPATFRHKTFRHKTSRSSFKRKTFRNKRRTAKNRQ